MKTFFKWLFLFFNTILVSYSHADCGRLFEDSSTRWVEEMSKVQEVTFKELKTDGEQPIPQMSRFEARLIRSLLKREEAMRKEDQRRFHGLDRFEAPCEDPLNDSRFANVSKSLLKEKLAELSAEGGSVRFVRIQARVEDNGNGAELVYKSGASFLRIEGGKPVLVFTPQVPESVFAHEFRHFNDWKKLRDQLVEKGYSAKKAAVEAHVLMSHPRGIGITESAAVYDERIKQKELVLRSGEKIPHHLHEGVVHFSRRESLRAGQWISDVIYPFLVQIHNGLAIRQNIDGWWYKLTSRSKTRSSVREELDTMINESIERLWLRASATYDFLVSECHRLERQSQDEGRTEDAKEYKKLRQEIESISLYEHVIRDTYETLIENSYHRFEVVRALKQGKREFDAKRILPTQISDQAKREIEKVLVPGRSLESEEKSGMRLDMFRVDRERGWGKTLKGDPRAYEQLDIDGLGYTINDQLVKGLLNGGRILYNLRAPLVDTHEIRQRQGAIKELMKSEAALLGRLVAIYSGRDSVDWRKEAFSGRTRPDLYRGLFSEVDLYDLARGKDYRGKKLESWKVYRGQLDMEGLESFLTEIHSFRALLTGATSERLRQLKWVFDACFEKDHPHSIATEVEAIFQADTLTKRATVIQKLFGDEAIKKLRVIEDAYGELAMYVDIARTSQRQGWRNFPEILDYDEEIGPILEAEGLHAPRILRTEPNNSVPNSVSLRGDGIRHIVVTGPNAQGKSTYGRKVAQLVIAAELGGPVPAKKARLTPLNVLAYVHPKDSPKDEMSLLMSEARALWAEIFNQALRDPFTIVVMDEILPGTIPEIRTDVETEFLAELNRKTGALSVTATHNWGTTELAGEHPGSFENRHVDRFHIKPGATTNLKAMYEGAADALRRVGWPEELIERVMRRGKKRYSPDEEIQ